MIFEGFSLIVNTLTERYAVSWDSLTKFKAQHIPQAKQ